MMPDVSKNAIIVIDGKESIKISENQDGKLIGEVTENFTAKPDALVTFSNYSPITEFLTSRDQRDLIRATQNNLNMIIVPYVRSVDDIASIRAFLNKNK
jgi:pyruvate kinase